MPSKSGGVTKKTSKAPKNTRLDGISALIESRCDEMTDQVEALRQMREDFKGIKYLAKYYDDIAAEIEQDVEKLGRSIGELKGAANVVEGAKERCSNIP